MKKEIVFAILLGILLAALFLYGFYITNQATQNLGSKDDSPTQIDSNEMTPSPQNLILSHPPKNYVSFQKNLKLSGSTNPNQYLAIISEGNEQIIQADEVGKFEAEIELIGGENLLMIASPSTNHLLDLKQTVVYTSAELDQEIASSSAKTVEQVIETLKSGSETSPSSLIGLVGTISSQDAQSLTLDSQDNLWQVSVDETTGIISKQKDVDLKDVPLNSRAIIIGTSPQNLIVFAKRIVIVNAPTSNFSRSAVYGTINSINNKEDSFSLTLAGKQETIEISLDKDSDLDDLGDIAIGQSLLAVIKTTTKDNLHSLLLHQDLN